jgi:hypothetical protein
MPIKRLFIETDILQKDELHSAQRTVRYILEDQGIPSHENVFDEIIDRAWHEWERAWEAVKRADEIYGDSSLVPLSGFGTYTGAPVVMDVMMKKAIEEKITGKSLYFLRDFNDIEWEGIDYKLLKKAFKKNKLFTLERGSNNDEFVEVDISKFDPW